MNDRIIRLLERYPEYKKTLTLALAYEASEGRKGWQWHDVETHPSKLIRLVTEGIASIDEKSRHATRYRLRDQKTVKETVIQP